MPTGSLQTNSRSRPGPVRACTRAWEVFASPAILSTAPAVFNGEHHCTKTQCRRRRGARAAVVCTYSRQPPSVTNSQSWRKVSSPLALIGLLAAQGLLQRTRAGKPGGGGCASPPPPCRGTSPLDSCQCVSLLLVVSKVSQSPSTAAMSGVFPSPSLSARNRKPTQREIVRPCLVA